MNNLFTVLVVLFLLVCAIATCLSKNLLVTVIIRLLIAALITAEGVIAVAAIATGGIGLFRILDLLIGRIDPLHLFCSFLITGIHIRVVFFR